MNQSAMNNVRHVSAWLPIRTPEWDHPERLYTYQLSRDQFMAQLPSAATVLSSKVTIHTVELANPPESLLNWFKERSIMAGTRLIEFIYLEGTASVDEEWLNQNSEIDENVIKHGALDELKEVLELILMLSELAYPGCIDTLECALVSDDVFITHFHGKRAHTRLGFPEEVAWPVIETIELIEVVDWASKTNLVHQHFAETRLERSLAAYSHVIGLEWSREGEVLFRAMQGLEAFYIDGIGDLRRQLSEKVQIWLGRWEGSRNVIGHLYDMRSGFIHGSSKLVYWNRDGGAWDEDELNMTKFESNVSLAIRLLAATLQKCIRQGITEVTWSYSVNSERDLEL